MIIVLFEVTIKEGHQEEYLKMAGHLKEELTKNEGFISSERFCSLATSNKLLSKSVWKDEESIASWRNVMQHRLYQKEGRDNMFEDYQITVVTPVRTYTMNSREEAPQDSNQYMEIKE